ncbi:MAG: hypothetical protein K0Q74_42 [Gammaproteobacteria bacterium]|jgi:ankyrin repeat protein|nr:hypothetical protein [Gammaproteobacteria bacterium]
MQEEKNFIAPSPLLQMIQNKILNQGHVFDENSLNWALKNLHSKEIFILCQHKIITPEMLNNGLTEAFKREDENKIASILKHVTFPLPGNYLYDSIGISNREKRRNIVQIFLQHKVGLDPAQENIPIINALRRAILQADLKTATMILEYGARTSSSNDYENFLLQIAVDSTCRNHRVLAVRLLLEYRTDDRIKNLYHRMLNKYKLRKKIELIFEYEFVNALHEQQNTYSGIVFSKEDKIKLLSELSEAIEAIGFIWSNKIKEGQKEALSLIKNKISVCKNGLEFFALVAAAQKTLHYVEAVIPDQIIYILSQLNTREKIESEDEEEKEKGELNIRQGREFLTSGMNTAQKNARLRWAMCRGNTAIAQRMLAMGVDPDIQDEDGVPLLLSFAYQNIEWGVALLLAYGANPQVIHNHKIIEDSPVFPCLKKDLGALIFEYRYTEQYRELCQQHIGQILDWTKSYDQLPKELQNALIKIPAKILGALAELACPPLAVSFFGKSEPINPMLAWVQKNIMIFDNHLKLQALHGWLHGRHNYPLALQELLLSTLEKIKLREDLNSLIPMSPDVPQKPIEVEMMEPQTINPP